MKEKKENPDFTLSAFQPRLKLNFTGDSAFSRFFYTITAKQLLESIHFCDSRELKIIRKSRDFNYLGRADYGRVDIYIPVEKIYHVKTTVDKSSSALARCEIEAGNKVFTTVMAANNPTLSKYSNFN